jgi:hypothetical protein
LVPKARRNGFGGFFFFDPSLSSYPHRMEEKPSVCSWCGDEDGVFEFIVRSNGKYGQRNLGAECWYNAIVRAIGEPKRTKLKIVTKRKKDEPLN